MDAMGMAAANAERYLRDVRLRLMLRIKLQELQWIQAQIAKAEGRDPEEAEG